VSEFDDNLAEDFATRADEQPNDNGFTAEEPASEATDMSADLADDMDDSDEEDSDADTEQALIS
jgi:hypothetical protein